MTKYCLNLWLFLLAGGLSACVMSGTPNELAGLTAQSPDTASPQWHDENEHVAGVCFESAWDAAGRIYIIRTAEEHIRFYDLADNSRLCRRPIGRVPRDFSTGYVIAGFWSRGIGCRAHHEVTGFVRNDDARTILMSVRFTIEGDCPYELVQPFWVGFDHAAGHEITIVMDND